MKKQYRVVNSYYEDGTIEDSNDYDTLKEAVEHECEVHDPEGVEVFEVTYKSLGYYTLKGVVSKVKDAK